MVTATKKTVAKKRPVPFAERALGLIEGLTTRVETLETDLAAARDEIAVLKSSRGGRRGIAENGHNKDFSIKRVASGKMGVWQTLTGKMADLKPIEGEEFDSIAEAKVRMQELAAAK